MDADSPAEHVAKLQADLQMERSMRVRAERDRNEYQDELHKANERIGMMTSAASSAAGTAEAAIRRLQRAEPVVKAAEGLVDAYMKAELAKKVLDEHEAANLCRVLIDSVLEYRKGAPS